MDCEHPPSNGYWKQDPVWVCTDCKMELKPHYYCKNCETDEWVSCKVVPPDHHSELTITEIREAIKQDNEQFD